MTDPAAPTPPDFTDVEAAIEDLRLQETTVRQLLGVLDEAGRTVLQGRPGWVDADVFGGTGKGERMARHTVGAQERVVETLHLAMAALAQHQGSLGLFRDEVLRVETEAEAELAAVRARVAEVPERNGVVL